MKIYTRKGDTGTTQLIGGARVKKNHQRIEAYGTVDELNSWIGFVRDHTPDRVAQEVLKKIQDRLFVIGALLATDSSGTKMETPDLYNEDVLLLESEIDRMQALLPELRSFILPGGAVANSAAHIARCVCRRAERLAVSLEKNDSAAPLVIQYLNRLSDYLFVLARKNSLDHGAQEVMWTARKS